MNKELDALVSRLCFKDSYMTKADRVDCYQAATAIKDLCDEVDRLQRILDSRPAINAGLPETYIQWSNGIYIADIGKAVGHN